MGPELVGHGIYLANSKILLINSISWIGLIYLEDNNFNAIKRKSLFFV